jgi:5'-3' exonuclease
VAVDPNGKAMPWLWVTLLPFIDEKLLLHTMREVEDQLTPEEKARNSFGKGKTTHREREEHIRRS